MIEGLRVLPGWQAALDDGRLPAYQRNCDECMAQIDPIRRQAMRCGYLPPLAVLPHGGESRAWQPPYMIDEPPIATCPGYTTSLPEVQEVRECFPQWETGNLQHKIDRPSPDLVDGCAVLKGAINAMSAQGMRDARAAQKAGDHDR